MGVMGAWWRASEALRGLLNTSREHLRISIPQPVTATPEARLPIAPFALAPRASTSCILPAGADGRRFMGHLVLVERLAARAIIP